MHTFILNGLRMSVLPIHCVPGRSDLQHSQVHSVMAKLPPSVLAQIATNRRGLYGVTRGGNAERQAYIAVVRQHMEQYTHLLADPVAIVTDFMGLSPIDFERVAQLDVAILDLNLALRRNRLDLQKLEKARLQHIMERRHIMWDGAPLLARIDQDSEISSCHIPLLETDKMSEPDTQHKRKWRRMHERKSSDRKAPRKKLDL